MVCGKCWKTVSGGVVDGDDAHHDYRYKLVIFVRCKAIPAMHHLQVAKAVHGEAVHEQVWWAVEEPA